MSSWRCAPWPKGEAARDEITRRHPDASLDVRALDLADLGSVRAFVAGLERDGCAERPGQQRRCHGGALADDDGRRLRAAVGNERPRPVRADQPPAADAAHRRHGARGDDVQRHGVVRTDRLRRPRLVPAVHPVAGLRPVRWPTCCSACAWPRWQRNGAGRCSARSRTRGTPTPTCRPPARAWVGAPRSAPCSPRVALPTQEVEQGSEPLLFAAADPGAVNGAYYGPDGRFGLVGPTTRVAIPRSARGASLARSLWAVAEDLTGTSLP